MNQFGFTFLSVSQIFELAGHKTMKKKLCGPKRLRIEVEVVIAKSKVFRGFILLYLFKCLDSKKLYFRVEVRCQIHTCIPVPKKATYNKVFRAVFFNLGSAEPKGSAKILLGSAKILLGSAKYLDISFLIHKSTTFRGCWNWPFSAGKEIPEPGNFRRKKDHIVQSKHPIKLQFPVFDEGQIQHFLKMGFCHQFTVFGNDLCQFHQND